MNDLNPAALFLGASFAVGFVARSVVGGYQRLTRKNGEVEIEVVEEPPLIPDIEKPHSEWVRNYSQIRLNDYAPPVDLRDVKTKFDPEELRYKTLRQVAANHENSDVLIHNIPVFKEPPVRIRILPPAKNHEVFEKSNFLNAITCKPQEQYYYNVIVRGEEDQGPKVLSVGPAVHRKIVEAFTKPEDDDISDIVDGSDLSLRYIEPYHKIDLVKMKCPLTDNVSLAESWLKKTSDLSKVGPIQKSVAPKSQKLLDKYAGYGSFATPTLEELQKASSCQKEPIITAMQGKKITSLAMDPELHDGLKARAIEESRSVSELVSDVMTDYLSKPFQDESEDRQKHFSTGEKVRLCNKQHIDTKAYYKKHLQWPLGMREECRLGEPSRVNEGEAGMIAGFVMQDSHGDIKPYSGGTAIVRFNKDRGPLYLAVNFKGLSSLDNGVAKNAICKHKVGDWVHWQTQAGHRSVRPSVVFKTRKTELGGTELQLGYVRDEKVKKFWCPPSKCDGVDTPQGFTGLVAHQLPESTMAEKLKML